MSVLQWKFALTKSVLQWKFEAPNFFFIFEAGGSVASKERIFVSFL